MCGTDQTPANRLRSDPKFQKNKKILAPLRSDEVEDKKVRNPLRSDASCFQNLKSELQSDPINSENIKLRTPLRSDKFLKLRMRNPLARTFLIRLLDHRINPFSPTADFRITLIIRLSPNLLLSDEFPGSELHSAPIYYEYVIIPEINRPQN